jgi:Leucine-rich repeat (LRR) protein
MTNLDMSANDFYGTEAGKALGDMLAVNTVLKQLDLSNCNMRIKSIKAFAVGIRNNGALLHLDISSNDIGKLASSSGWVKEDKQNPDFTYMHPDGRHQKEPPEGEHFKPEGTIAIADAIPDMKALSSLNLASNSIGGSPATQQHGVRATPEGTPCGQLDLSCAYIRSICRPCCYR